MVGQPTGFSDGARARAHIATLKAMGIGTPRIAELSGMPQVTIWRVSNSDRVLARTEARILAIALPSAAHEIAKDGASVALIGTQRRLRALQVAGYTTARLGDLVGIGKRAVVNICSDSQTYVTAEVARRVAALFDDLQATPGGNKTTRARSLAKGWHPALAWDEDAIDDPDAVPHTSEDRNSDWYDSYLELLEFGIEPKAAAERVGVPWETAWRRADRNKKKAA